MMWKLTYILTAIRQSVWGMDSTLSANQPEGGKRWDNIDSPASRANLPSGVPAYRAPAPTTTPRTSLLLGFVPWLNGWFKNTKRGVRRIGEVHCSNFSVLDGHDA